MKSKSKKLSKKEKVTETKVYLHESDKAKIEFILERNPEIQSRSEMFRQMLNNQYEMEMDDYDTERTNKINYLVDELNAFAIKYGEDDFIDWDGEKYYLRNGLPETLNETEFIKARGELLELSDVALKMIADGIVKDADYKYLIEL